MENKQQKPEKETLPEAQSSTEVAPGQQLPVGNLSFDNSGQPAKEEQHSESSLPQQGNETLGTP